MIIIVVLFHVNFGNYHMLPPYRGDMLPPYRGDMLPQWCEICNTCNSIVTLKLCDYDVRSFHFYALDQNRPLTSLTALLTPLMVHN